MLFADIDECDAGVNNCHIDAECANTFGSFTCTCIDGYEGNGTDCTGTPACMDRGLN